LSSTKTASRRRFVEHHNKRSEVEEVAEVAVEIEGVAAWAEEEVDEEAVLPRVKDPDRPGRMDRQINLNNRDNRRFKPRRRAYSRKCNLERRHPLPSHDRD